MANAPNPPDRYGRLVVTPQGDVALTIEGRVPARLLVDVLAALRTNGLSGDVRVADAPAAPAPSGWRTAESAQADADALARALRDLTDARVQLVTVTARLDGAHAAIREAIEANAHGRDAADIAARLTRFLKEG